jgi:hypothetical protein
MASPADRAVPRHHIENELCLSHPGDLVPFTFFVLFFDGLWRGLIFVVASVYECVCNPCL